MKQIMVPMSSELYENICKRAKQNELSKAA